MTDATKAVESPKLGGMMGVPGHDLGQRSLILRNQWSHTIGLLALIAVH